MIEVAPGIDIDRDILAHMGFAPKVDDPKAMVLTRKVAPHVFETQDEAKEFLRRSS